MKTTKEMKEKLAMFAKLVLAERQESRMRASYIQANDIAMERLSLVMEEMCPKRKLKAFFEKADAAFFLLRDGIETPVSLTYASGSYAMAKVFEEMGVYGTKRYISHMFDAVLAEDFDDQKDAVFTVSVICDFEDEMDELMFIYASMCSPETNDYSFMTQDDDEQFWFGTLSFDANKIDISVSLFGGMWLVAQYIQRDVVFEIIPV